MYKCKKCDSEKYIKAGFVKGKQRYKCKKCNCQFVPTRKSRARSENTKNIAVLLYISGLSLRMISKILKTDLHAVYRWIKKFASKNYSKPAPKSDAVIVELDEMWHYLHSKKTNLGLESLLPRYSPAHRLGMWWTRYAYICPALQKIAKMER
jgi:transposase-like protein